MSKGTFLECQRSFEGREDEMNFKRKISYAVRRITQAPFMECLLSGHSHHGLGVPRQFEYHPRLPNRMIIGTVKGDIILLNPRESATEKIITTWSTPRAESILGLCWLKSTDDSKFLSGSDEGSVRLMDTNRMIRKEGGPVYEFEKFPYLTSVSCNCVDDHFMTSGYSKDVALYDLGTGQRIDKFESLHAKDHINVLKFANHDPNIFATSSFDSSVKLWDLRMDIKSGKSIYHRQSHSGVVMVCFSDDDRFLLSSAVDNEVNQVFFLGGGHFFLLL